MKKHMIILLVLMVIFTGCAAKIDENIDRAPYEEKAETDAKLFLTGEAEKLYPEFTDTLARQIPLETLVNQSLQFSIMNQYVQTLEVSSQLIDQYIVVDVLSEMTSSKINTRISYTTDGKIAGIYFSNSPLIPALLPGEEEIKVGEHELAGRLMLPDHDGAPIVILIAGSGSHGMDEIIGAAGNAPLRDLALGLQDRGIATIRYDKRFYSAPQLAAQKPQLTIGDEVLDDVDWIIEHIESYQGVDSSKLFVLGHSLGGMLVPDIAARHSQVKGIISLAGSPRKLEDIMEEQMIAQIEAATEMTAEEKESQLAVLEKNMASIREQDWASSPFGAQYSYWESLHQVYAPVVVERITQPMLILQGSADQQIFADRDYRAWKELLKDRDNITYKLYEGLNHLFMKKIYDDPVEDYNIPGHVEPEVLDDIAEWIHSH